MDFTLYWFMFPVAICVATLAMLSGIGGAALFTPIFILVFPLIGPEYALPTTLAAIAAALITQTFGFLSGFIGYYRRRLIDFGLAFRFLRISVPVAIVGAFVANLVHDGVLVACYATLVLLLAIGLWWQKARDLPHVKTGADSGIHTLVDSTGWEYHYPTPTLGLKNVGLTGLGAFLTGMVSVGIGEVTVAQLTRRNIPIAVAAATSVLVVILTVLAASTTLTIELIQAGGWTAVPWNLLIYDIPGVLIGGQIGPRLQGLVPQRTMQRGIAMLFVVLSLAMMGVALQKFGVLGAWFPIGG